MSMAAYSIIPARRGQICPLPSLESTDDRPVTGPARAERLRGFIPILG